MEQYEDDEANRERTLANAQVLGFIAGYWGRRPFRIGATIVTTLIAIGFETWTPRATQNLVNITALGPTAGLGDLAGLGDPGRRLSRRLGDPQPGFPRVLEPARGAQHGGDDQ